jgi:hypothetical protein
MAYTGTSPSEGKLADDSLANHSNLTMVGGEGGSMVVDGTAEQYRHSNRRC